MRRTWLSRWAVLFAVLALTGCSFEASVSDDTTQTTSRSSTTPVPTTGSSTGSAGSGTAEPSTPSTSTGGGVQEIRFPVGATSTSVSGVAETGAHDRYTFAARAGQTATLSITSQGNVVGYSLGSPDGEPLVNLMSEAKDSELVLPVDGEYVVGIGSPTAGISFALTLSVQ